MKKLLFILFSICIGAAASFAQIIEKPNPPSLVVDETGTLSGDEVERLKQKLIAYDDSTSTQIEVVFIKTLNGIEPVDYAQQIGEGWGIGQKDKDNGIVMLVSIGDHKMWIHTGRGVGDKITDAFAYDVVNDIMKPAFKQNRYYQGVDEATTAIMQQLNGTYKADKKRDKGWSLTGIIFLVIIAFIILTTIFGKRGGGGGNGGGGLGGLWPLLFMGSGRGGGGFGGGGFGGGSSGGGFGGFGGGSFGGGGAGGSW